MSMSTTNPITAYTFVYSKPTTSILENFGDFIFKTTTIFPILISVFFISWILLHVFEGLLKIALDYNSLPGISVMIFLLFWCTFETGARVLIAFFFN